MKVARLLYLLIVLLVLSAFAPAFCFGQIVTLADANASLTLTLSGAPSTTQPNYSVTWTGTGGPADSVGAATGATAATMLSGLAGGPRQVESVHIYNADSASITATVKKVVSGTGTTLLSATVPVAGSLRWSKLEGIKVLDASGAVVANSTGSVPAAVTSTCVATETGSGGLRSTKFTFTNMPVSLRDTTAPAQGGGQQIYAFPEGRIYIIGATGTVTVTTTSAIATTLNTGVSARWGVGTVTQANTTLATTEQDLLPVTTFTSGTTINVANTATTAALASPAVFDGTSTAKQAFFNISVPTATDIDADATVAINGTVTIVWAFLGDY